MSFCFVFQEILYGFGEEFFSLTSTRCRERLDTRRARKNVIVFFVVLIAEFRLWSGSQNRILSNIEREP